MTTLQFFDRLISKKHQNNINKCHINMLYIEYYAILPHTVLIIWKNTIIY